MLLGGGGRGCVHLCSTVWEGCVFVVCGRACVSARLCVFCERNATVVGEADSGFWVVGD